MHQPLAGPCRSLAGEALVDPVLANDSPTRELSCPFEERLARSLHDKTVRMQPCERAAAAYRACAPRRAHAQVREKSVIFNVLLAGFIFVRHCLRVELDIVCVWSASWYMVGSP